ncbi:MAG: PEP-utilizing enzyme [Nanoarchaeota archaeon]
MSFEIFERIYSGHWFLSSYNGPGFVRDFPKIGGGKFITKAIYVMENQMCRYIFDNNEFEKAANFTADRLINDDKWRLSIYKKIDFYTKKYFQTGENLRKLNLSSLSSNKLAQIINKIISLQHHHQVYSILVNGVVLDGRNHLSNKIRNEVKSALGNTKKFEDYWSLLTLVTKMSLRQEKDYEISLIAKKSKNMSKKDTSKKLMKLYEKYCWIDYNNLGPPASFKTFENELEDAIKNNIHLSLPMQLKNIKAKQEKLMRELRFNKRLRFLVNLSQYVIWQKGFRKDMQYHGFYCYENLFKELARRNGTGDWQAFSFLFPWEVEKFLIEKTPSISELNERRKFSCFIVSKDELGLKIGKEARKFSKSLNLLEDFFHLKETKGQCAYIGKVKGYVKVVQIPSDISKMNKGDILISQATSPDLLPAMKIAGAIVTNTGGLICHAAITSRELKLPCIVGTGNATLIFRDGDLVEVNATKGIIRKLK